MSQKLITLDTAAFMDSPRAAALEAPREDVKRLVEAFLKACYEGVGKKPRLLDGHDAHAVLGHVMPGYLKRKDPAAAHARTVLEAYVAHMEETEIVPNAFELKRGLDGTLDEFQETVRTGQNAHVHSHGREKPFTHTAAKTERNDPCPCGSGKKFKKCHGQAS